MVRAGNRKSARPKPSGVKVMHMKRLIAIALFVAGCGGAAAVPSALPSPSPEPSPITSPSLSAAETAAVHLDESVRAIQELGSEDVQGVYDWFRAENVWLAGQPDTMVLSDYRFLITTRYDELKAAQGLSILHAQEIVAEVIEKADAVPGVDLD